MIRKHRPLFFISLFFFGLFLTVLLFFHITPSELEATERPVVKQLSTASKDLDLEKSAVYSVTEFGAVGDGQTDSAPAFQAAIEKAKNESGVVTIPAGTYYLDSTVDILGNISLIGEGRNLVKITGTGDLFHILGKEKKVNITVKGITFDVNHQQDASAIIAEYIENFTLTDSRFLNLSVWGIHIGSQDAQDTQIRNRNILIENVEFHQIDQTYEQLLLFNAENVIVKNCLFRTGEKGIGIGIYEHAKNITIENSIFDKLNIGLYYSLTTSDIHIENTTFKNNNIGIQGANQSDNDKDGTRAAERINVEKSSFTNNMVGLEIGAATYVTVLQSTFEENFGSGLVIDNGNAPVNIQAKDITIMKSVFKNNNQLRKHSVLHPGILFSGTGGEVHTIIDQCQFLDTQLTPTQLYPISFTGNYSWSDITISNSRLSSYHNGEGSFGISNGAKFGKNIKLIRNKS